ncbi:MAG: hypothetical protein ACYDHY_18135 [Acidiferrobacterales bacterium]
MFKIARDVRHVLWFVIYAVWPRWVWIARWFWGYLGLWAVSIYAGTEGRAIRRDSAAPASAQIASVAEVGALIAFLAVVLIVWMPIDVPLWIAPVGLAMTPILFSVRLEHWARSR